MAAALHARFGNLPAAGPMHLVDSRFRLQGDAQVQCLYSSRRIPVDPRMEDVNKIKFVTESNVMIK